MFNIENRRYVGNKFKLCPWIRECIASTCHDLDSFFDVFAGTGVVTAAMLDMFNSFYLNDFLFSNEVIYKGFFLNRRYRSNIIEKEKELYEALDEKTIEENYVSENYGGKFFAYGDAKKIGFIRQRIETLREQDAINLKEYCILLASLLYSLDKSANTVGHYDAYIKRDGLRSSFEFDLIRPVITQKKIFKIYREDSNLLAPRLRTSLAFIDPPYNSRQYSRFYHVLETITKWDYPELHGVAMKPQATNMSDYCRNAAATVFEDLIEKLNVRYIAVTYNNTYTSKSSSSQNKITLEQISAILRKRGKTQIFEKSYRFFNSGKTDFSDHKEFLFITEVSK